MGERSQLIIASKSLEESAPTVHSVYYHWLHYEGMIQQATEVIKVMQKWRAEFVAPDGHTTLSDLPRYGSRASLMRMIANVYDVGAVTGRPLEGEYTEEMMHWDTNHGAFVVYLTPKTWKIGFLTDCALRDGENARPLSTADYLATIPHHDSPEKEIHQQVIEFAASKLLSALESDHLLTSEELDELNIW